MAGKFVDLSEAARLLGVTPEQLIELRSKGEIFGYRDGSSWKFKQEEVERVQSERMGADDDSAEILSTDDADFEQMITGLSSKILGDRSQEDKADSILISDDDLSAGPGASKKGPSTIIGRGGISNSDNDISLSGIGKKGPGHSDALSPSDLKMKTESDVLAGSAPRGPTGSATGVMAGGSKKSPDDDLSFADSALGMGSDIGGKSVADDDLMLGDDSLGLDDLSMSGSMSDAPAKSSAASAPSGIEDDEYSLGDDVLGDEPRVKGGSGGSDVTFGGGDSGINLAPSDAGLSLEEPMDLGGSAVDSLSLPGDEDVIAMDDSLADPDQATQLKADEQFQLSPDGFIEDASDSDSGSQVIALEESDSFDHDAATQLRSDELQPSLVAEDAFTMSPTMGGSGPMPMPAGSAAAGYMMQPVEAPYSIWQVLTLMVLTGILAFSGMLMVDIMSNMWSWQGTGSASTSIADSVISVFGLDK